jgi:hypothetical protein
MEEVRKSHIILEGKPETKRTLGDAGVGRRIIL